ncbi:hypothetical protein A8C56_20470 [Niabella ginsenosidivorans]|uniref:Uncharacterized protein n=1 Tax=Niabella ginsenosidivorans TaxID=1176587 RepID=A0A1A9I8P8_9BACT|nr:DUF4091 domain-containing protein [Niabella ginsenosidivorans]ANH83042.1 hypothetical protein A8C56_20470 [Niabella ginsenosidivorans]
MKNIISYKRIIYFVCLLTVCSYTIIPEDSLVIGFADTNMRYSYPLAKNTTLASSWNGKAWKGEKISQQLLVYSDQQLPGIKVKATALKDAKGNLIAEGAFSVSYVGYVWTDGFGNRERSCISDRRGIVFDSSMVADPLFAARPGNSTTKNLQPVWISIEVPRDISAGIYKGAIEITGKKKYRLPINIEVINKTLPPPAQWKFHLDLWQHPAAVARAEHVPLWSNEHFEAMRSLYSMLAKAGQKVITTSIVNEPWGHQTYDDYPALIRWIKKRDGSWKYDYSLFDRYVAFVMSCGINEQINCYSMLPWGLSFSYYDEATQQVKSTKCKPGSDAYARMWKPMLIDFERHLQQKGWFDITTIAMDERGLEDMKYIIGLLKSLNKKWKVALAGNYHPEIEKDIYDYCLASKFVYPDSVLNRRKAEKLKSTYYTCCAERFPNSFTFSPPAESTWLGIYAAANHFDGYLRWAYNSWPDKPLQDSRFTMAPAGDCFLVYPFATSSIRFEKLIEGIQLYEKIRIIKSNRSGKTSKQLSDLTDALKEFSIKSAGSGQAASMVQKIKDILNRESI